MNANDSYRAGKTVDEFSGTIWDSYREILSSTLEAHERNVELTLNVFESGMEAMEEGVEFNRRAALKLAERMRKQREAFESISRESAGAYEGFLGSLSDYYREVSKKPEGPA